MQSEPDEHSSLRGKELINAKVKKFVIAGGRNPAGTSSNVSKDLEFEFNRGKLLRAVHIQNE